MLTNMAFQDLTIVIASFNSESKIRKCLNSINKECKVLNIENSSDINYKSKIEAEFANVKCILSGSNLGYGKANNIGLNKVKTKYALILNPDTELFPDTLINFLTLAKNKQDFAIIGPEVIEDKINLNNKKSSTQNEKLMIDEVLSVKGFAMFLNLKEFKDVGFFDENIFFFLEEIDLCKRLIKNNKKIYYCKNILVFHEGGKSHNSIVNYPMELSRNWHWMWSQFYFKKKYDGYLVALFKSIPILFLSLIKSFFYLTILKRNKSAIYYQRFSGLINSIFCRKSWYRPRINKKIDLL
ncbi:MAG: glycosyltransferase [Pelagibacteraceae bacterium]